LQKEPRQKSTHIKIATKTETKIDRHKICNKNLDKSTHIKIALTEKNQYTQKLQQKLRENKKHIKIAKTATKSHTHTQKRQDEANSTAVPPLVQHHQKFHLEFILGLTRKETHFASKMIK
jgi:hypothetical protein